MTYDLGHYEVLHEVDTIKIRFHHCNDEIIFVSDKLHAKCPRNLTMKKQNSNFEKKRAKFQTKAQKNSKVHFFRGDLVAGTGEREISAVARRIPDNPGEVACMHGCSPEGHCHKKSKSLRSLVHYLRKLFILCLSSTGGMCPYKLTTLLS